MKKILIAFGIFLFSCLLILLGCSQQPSKVNKVNYDLIISNKGSLVLFQDKEGKLEVVKTLHRISPENFGFITYNTLEFPTEVYGMTRHHGGQNPYLYHFDKENLQLSAKKIPRNKIYPDTIEHDGQYIYGRATSTSDIYFYKYDVDFNLVKEKAYPNTTSQMNINNFIVVEDKLYVVIGMADKETREYFSELWILNTDLEVEEKISLDTRDDLRRVGIDLVHGNGILYISQWYDVELLGDVIGGGKTIQTFNLATKELGEIKLKHPYPHEIFYDNKRQVLQIAHDPVYVPDNIRTFIDMKTGEQSTLTLGNGDESAYSTEHQGDYYYVFKKKLVKYNYDSGEKVEYDLSDYGIKEADIIFFNDK